MHETKPKSFAEGLLARSPRTVVDASVEDELPESGTRERQSSGGAFSLKVIFKDGRHRETFPWVLYGGHQWSDEGGMECLTVLFGSRVLIIHGHNFDQLDEDLSLGKRTSIKQHNSHQIQLLKNDNSENLPVVVEIEAYPPYPQMVAEIKGDDEHDTGKSRRTAR